MRSWIGLSVLIVLWPAVAFSEMHELRLPLRDGRLSLAQLQDSLGHVLHVPQTVLDRLGDLDGSIDLQGIGGWVAVRAIDEALGDGFQIQVNERELVIEFDPAKLPKDWGVGDKTGTGERGTANDIAILWPPGRGPVLVTAYLTETDGDATRSNAAIASVGALVVSSV